MRAKEYLEIYKKKIYNFQEVKNAVQGLYPLRCSKRKTEEYFNKNLFADAINRSFIDRSPSIAICLSLCGIIQTLLWFHLR